MTQKTVTGPCTKKKIVTGKSCSNWCEWHSVGSFSSRGSITASQKPRILLVPKLCITQFRKLQFFFFLVFLFLVYTTPSMCMQTMWFIIIVRREWVSTWKKRGDEEVGSERRQVSNYVYSIQFVTCRCYVQRTNKNKPLPLPSIPSGHPPPNLRATLSLEISPKTALFGRII